MLKTTHFDSAFQHSELSIHAFDPFPAPRYDFVVAGEVAEWLKATVC